MRKWLVSILAVPAVLLPLAATAQVAPEKPARPVSDLPKYQVYAGFSYTSLNQVNQSRYGLIGGNVEFSRDFGRWFAVVGDGAYFPSSYASGNPGNPKVTHVLGGVEVHAPIFEKWNLFGRGLIGMARTTGENMDPDTSFAGGPGVGVEHTFSTRWGIRASGDIIGSSFSLRNNTTQLGNSAHMRWNARAGIGITYRF